MKLALFGASGTIGQRILREALRRGHTVTAIMRDPSRLTDQHPHLTAVVGDVLDPARVAAAVAGHEAVLSAYGPTGGAGAETIAAAARALITGLNAAGVTRLVVVGGAGSLEVAPGRQLIDTPQFPEAKPVARAHAEALAIYRTAGADLAWSYLSPAALVEPGERTGAFRLGGDQLLTDAEGQSRISAEDYAVAFLDEVEHPRHVRQRFTVAY
jgi:uncharacterized protein